MITPENIKTIDINKVDMAKLETMIDDSIKRFHGSYPWETAIIDGEYPVEVRDKIALKYKESGWNHVYHRTTSENGERAGLTSFVFSTEPLKPEYTKNYHEV